MFGYSVRPTRIDLSGRQRGRAGKVIVMALVPIDDITSHLKKLTPYLR
jgi:hypothetical protein